MASGLEKQVPELIAHLSASKSLNVSGNWAKLLQLYHLDGTYVCFAEISNERRKELIINRPLYGAGKAIDINASINLAIYELIERYLSHCRQEHCNAYHLGNPYNADVKTSAGCALGSSMQQATESANHELDERIAISTWWYSNRTAPTFNVDAIGGLSEALTTTRIYNRCHQENIGFYIIDLSKFSPSQSPTVSVITHENNFTLIGASSSSSISTALEKASLEHEQMKISAIISKILDRPLAHKKGQEFLTTVTKNLIESKISLDLQELQPASDPQKKRDVITLGTARLHEQNVFCVRSIPRIKEEKQLNWKNPNVPELPF